jgi:hypothetical protein
LFSDIVRAATSTEAGTPLVTALPCRRRPGRRRCSGFLTVLRTDIPGSIDWACPDCGDQGLITGWEHSIYDLRSAHPPASHDPVHQVEVPADLGPILRNLLFLDTAAERLVFGARAKPSHRMVLTGTNNDFEELTGTIAAEANHEPNRTRRRRLDHAFDILTTALA